MGGGDRREQMMMAVVPSLPALGEKVDKVRTQTRSRSA